MATATFNATMFARRYNSSNNMLDDRASQGATTLGQVVGVLNFRTLNMQNKVITGITFITTCTSSAGRNNDATKTLYFKRSTRADPTSATGGTGGSYVGDTIGSLSGTNFYNASNISRVVNTGSALFANLKAYFEAGNHTLVLYAPDTVPSDGYSANYLYLDGLNVVITYEEGLMHYDDNGVWRKCLVYWADNGSWVQCIPYYGSGGAWNQCGG